MGAGLVPLGSLPCATLTSLVFGIGLAPNQASRNNLASAAQVGGAQPLGGARCLVAVGAPSGCHARCPGLGTGKLLVAHIYHHAKRPLHLVVCGCHACLLSIARAKLRLLVFSRS